MCWFNSSKSYSVPTLQLPAPEAGWRPTPHISPTPLHAHKYIHSQTHYVHQAKCAQMWININQVKLGHPPLPPVSWPLPWALAEGTTWRPRHVLSREKPTWRGNCYVFDTPANHLKTVNCIVATTIQVQCGRLLISSWLLEPCCRLGYPLMDMSNCGQGRNEPAWRISVRISQRPFHTDAVQGVNTVCRMSECVQLPLEQARLSAGMFSRLLDIWCKGWHSLTYTAIHKGSWDLWQA